jgi:hypothetical protein
MRLLLGIILGAVLTVGGAYVHDSNYATAGSAAVSQRQLVNWDVVSSTLQRVTDRARAEWNRHVG